MTKKDYIRASKLIQEISDTATIKLLEDIFVAFFKADNVKFDESKFRRACKSK